MLNILPEEVILSEIPAPKTLDATETMELAKKAVVQIVVTNKPK
jgi:hypothetical protein